MYISSESMHVLFSPTAKFDPAISDKRGIESGVKIFAVRGREGDETKDSTLNVCKFFVDKGDV
jgi:hypothetical protein